MYLPLTERWGHVALPISINFYGYAARGETSAVFLFNLLVFNIIIHCKILDICLYSDIMNHFYRLIISFIMALIWSTAMFPPRENGMFFMQIICVGLCE